MALPVSLRRTDANRISASGIGLDAAQPNESSVDIAFDLAVMLRQALEEDAC
jgi:hypothetical protein